MPKEQRSPIQQVNERIENLEVWIQKHKVLLSATDRVKITLSIKGTSVVGEVTSFPD